MVLIVACLTGCSAKVRNARHKHLGDKYFAEENLSKAEVEYLIALQLDNADQHTISRLANIYFQQGRLQRAYAFSLRATELSTNDVDLRLKLATIYLTAHKVKEAHEQAQWILAKSPTNTLAPEILVESISSRQELDQATQLLDKLVKQNGDTAPLEVAYSIEKSALGDLKSAEAAARRALELDPKSASAYAALGSIYLVQQKTNDAGDAFKKAADLSPIRSTRRLSYANFKIQIGDLEEGKRLIHEITEKAPDYLPAWLQGAEIALGEKRYSDCLALLNQALAKDRDNYEALLLQGRMDLAQGKYDKAVAELDRMASLYDRSPQVQYFLACAHVAINERSKAAADLNKALFLQPGDPEATMLLAELNIQKGDPTSAITSLTDLIKRWPGSAQGYMLLADAYVTQKNYDQAMKVYEQMAKYFPNSPQVPLLTGVVLVRQSKDAEARKSFEKALGMSPNFIVAQEELVNLDIAEGNYTAALDRADKAAEQNRGPAPQLILAKIHIARANSIIRQAAKTNSAVRRLADVPATQDDVNRAEAALVKAIRIDTNLSSAYLLLAKLYVSAGKEQAALNQLNNLVNQTNNVDAYLEMGMIYETMTNYPAARDAYEKMVAVAPEAAVGLNNLAYLYSEHLSDNDKAYQLADKARQLSPRDPATADTLGWILYKRGEYTRALSLETESVSKLPTPEVQLHLGLVQYMLGNENAARAALAQAANSSDDFPHKEEAAQHLAILAIDPKAADAKAQTELEKKLQDDPNDPVAANRLAAIYERSGTPDKAAKIYERTLKQNPQNAQTMGKLARIYAGQNESVRALDLAKQAHKILPDDSAISALLGRLAFQTGDYNWAASLLQDAAPRLPNQPEVMCDLAWAFYAVGRVPEAERSMRSAASALTGPKLDNAKWFLAMVAAAKSPDASTAAQARQILNSDTNYVPALMVLARQAALQGKADDAATLYEKVLTRYPGFLPAIRDLAISFVEHPGDDSKVYELSMKARSSFPDDNELSRALGVLAYRKGDYARAAQLLQESSDNPNKDGELLYYLGMAHYQLKQKAQSKTELQHALTLNLSPKLAEDARKTLADLQK